MMSKVELQPYNTILGGFGGSMVQLLGKIQMWTSCGETPKRRTELVDYLVVEGSFQYQVIFGRPDKYNSGS